MTERSETVVAPRGRRPVEIRVTRIYRPDRECEVKALRILLARPARQATDAEKDARR